MRFVLDSGAFIGLERGDAVLWALLKRQQDGGGAVISHGGVVGQVWRGGGGRQALLARALAGVDVLDLDDDLGRRAGLLMGRTGTSDVVDAALVASAVDGDRIFTSDPEDIRVLAQGAETEVDIIRVA